MVILNAIKHRIYPRKAQAELLEKQFGRARFMYNRYLAMRKEYYLAHKDDPQKKGLMTTIPPPNERVKKTT